MSENTLFSTSRAAQILDVSTNTLTRWYKWYENDEWVKPADLKLPEYTVDNRKTKFFTFEAIQELMKFRDDLKGRYRGVMADFNAVYQWGTYGKNRGAESEQKNS